MWILHPSVPDSAGSTMGLGSHHSKRPAKFPLSCLGACCRFRRRPPSRQGGDPAMFAAFGHPQKDDLGDRWLERDCSCSQGVEAREQLGACRAVARGRQPLRRRSRQWKRLQHESHRKSVHCEEMGPQTPWRKNAFPQWSRQVEERARFHWRKIASDGHSRDLGNTQRTKSAGLPV